MRNLKKQIILILLSMILLTGTIVPTVFADAALTNARFEATGEYSIVASGVGLEWTATGAIIINVPGSSVIAAYLYWAGFDDTGGDNAVLFQGTPLIADEQFGPDLWKESYDSYVYVADVTTKISTGSHPYTIAEVELHENYGAGLIVVYEDSTLPLAKVTILDGLDSFYFELDDPIGPDSAVTCLEFDAANYDSVVEMTLLVGGTEHEDRPNAIWTETGTGSPTPVDLIDPASLPTGGYPLVASDGRSWDTYTDGVLIPAGDEWLCVQIESIVSQITGDDNAGLGNSALLAAAGFVLPIHMGGKVTGGGQIPLGDGKKETATFGFNAMVTSKDPNVKGELQYLDHTTGRLVHAHIVDSLYVWEELVGNKPWPLRKAVFSGPCTVNHIDGYRFKVYVEDNGEPGKADKFSIKVWDATDNLIIDEFAEIIRGNIQIHKP